VEIINDSQAEARRIQAMVHLVASLENPIRQDIIDLAQPQALGANSTSPLENTYKIAVDCNLIWENNDKFLEVPVPLEQVASMEAFQDYMRHVVLGVTKEQQSNYRFNLFSAWYAVQNEKVLYELASTDYDQFNIDIAPATDKDRLFNSTKLPAWRKWAMFLGLGWVARLNARNVLVPDATKRIQAVLFDIFQNDVQLTFGQFMEQISVLCPELDGGILFNYCWQTSRSSELRSNRLSLMLSTGLRTLASLRVIRLLNQADALDVWQLYPAQGNPYQQVTHIQRLGV
jgi:hypothetical protein